MYRYADLVEETIEDEEDLADVSSFSYPGHQSRPMAFSVFRRNSGPNSGQQRPTLPPRLLPLLAQQKNIISTSSVCSEQGFESQRSARLQENGEENISFNNQFEESTSCKMSAVQLLSTPNYRTLSSVTDVEHANASSSSIKKKMNGQQGIEQHTLGEITFPPSARKTSSLTSGRPVEKIIHSNRFTPVFSARKVCGQDTIDVPRKPVSEVPKLEISKEENIIKNAPHLMSPIGEQDHLQVVRKVNSASHEASEIKSSDIKDCLGEQLQGSKSQSMLSKQCARNRSATPFKDKEKFGSVTQISESLTIENHGCGLKSVGKSQNKSQYCDLLVSSTHYSQNTPYRQDRSSTKPHNELLSASKTKRPTAQIVNNMSRDIFSNKLMPSSDTFRKVVVMSSNCDSENKSKQIENKENDSIPQILEKPDDEVLNDNKRIPLKETISDVNRVVYSNNFKKPARKALMYDPVVKEQSNLPTVKEKEEKLPVKSCNKEVPAVLPSLQDQKSNTVIIVKTKEYSVLSRLGVGGSSQVFQVLEPKTHQLLAIKCVSLADADPSTAEGYLNEIKLLSKLQNCRKVIKLFDHEYVKQQQILYVVMEKGDVDLSTLLKKMWKDNEVLSMPMIIYYWTEILSAVKDIHDHGIVHSDLKPANFLLVAGRLKLIDFGIASSVQNDMTSIHKNGMVGTYNYMSPEAIQDPGDKSKSKVGYKSDVWSLGCILYNMLYGKTPFQHLMNSFVKLKAITNPGHKIEYPHVEKCPPVLMEAVKRCLTYNSKLRPTVTDLLNLPYISYNSLSEKGKET